MVRYAAIFISGGLKDLLQNKTPLLNKGGLFLLSQTNNRENLRYNTSIKVIAECVSCVKPGLSNYYILSVWVDC